MTHNPCFDDQKGHSRVQPHSFWYKGAGEGLARAAVLAWAGLGTQASQPSGGTENRHHQSFHNVPRLISVHVGHPDDDDGQEMMGDVATSSLETTADQIVRPVYR